MTAAKKKQKLRNNEYYDLQDMFDSLYAHSKEGVVFNNLLPLITEFRNILLAYRNIKKNKGSKTRGANLSTIITMGEKEQDKLIAYVTNRLKNFSPHPVRRVEIEKDDGRMRPLGIPTIEDRLIQQCIKQVLEPICEAKFHKHSYGFRPNRSTRHAYARAAFLINRSGFRYVVDIDIKGFFDNVNHGKLLKQIWSMGIRDKNLLCILSKMLKAEIKGIGIPDKGVPQGGLLSPLLSNIVLNELDWWISNQWESFPARKSYKQRSHQYDRLRKTGKLKEVFLVRYADDLKLFCKTRTDAVLMFEATQKWLSERLGLEISPEKSQVINLKRKYSEFLGFKLKLLKKQDKWVVTSHMKDKAIQKATDKLRRIVEEMRSVPTADTANRFNAAVLGLHNYYRCATLVNLDFSKIGYQVYRSLVCKTKRVRNPKGQKSKAYAKFYGNYHFTPFYIGDTALFPVSAITTKPAIAFTQKWCNYTKEGRAALHDNLRCVNPRVMEYLLNNPVQGESAEYNDNRISLYAGQEGCCGVTGQALRIGRMEVHHKDPKQNGGSDNYMNLIFVTAEVHKLIHATTPETIERYLPCLQKSENALQKLNRLRIQAGNVKLDVNR
jgi:group II intron reverse transcriptase/maturase